MNPNYPVYIISKDRWKSRLTSKAFERMNVPYMIAVEEHEYDLYCSVIDPSKVLKLPFSNHGFGSTHARNHVWQHAIDRGAKRHWIVDDNIDAFHRLHDNKRVVVESGTIFRCAEDFVDRYTNVALAGFNYYSFCKSTDGLPAYVANTRIYSCILIDNNIPFQWECKYNEDTDLSLRVLKSGLCTIQFNAFLQGKTTTLRMSGGNTKELYGKGSLNHIKSQMLVDRHPDVARLSSKFNRVHHHVNYSGFKKNLLIKKDIVVPDRINDYGMKLIKKRS